MPLIVLSATDEERHQVRAFEAGADDYLTKPFRPRELVARLQAKLRRAGPDSEESRVNLGGLEIDLCAHAARRDGELVHLTPIEFKLLAMLAKNPGRLLSHNALLQEVWGRAYLDDKQTLRTHIANLRRKIELGRGGQLIRTRHGLGYCLLDPHIGDPGPAQPVDSLIEPTSNTGRLVPLRQPSPVSWAGGIGRRTSITPYGRRVA